MLFLFLCKQSLEVSGTCLGSRQQTIPTNTSARNIKKFHLNTVFPPSPHAFLTCSNSVVYSFSLPSLIFCPLMVTGLMNVIFFPLNAAARETSPQLRKPGR